MIKIIEFFIKGKTDNFSCEDTCFTSENFVAVIDGVTSKTDFRYEGKTTGKLASEMIYKVMSKARREDSVQEIITRINEAFEEFYRKVPFPYDKSQKGLQAAGVIYSSYYNEIWMIGDCQAAVDGVVYLNTKKSDVVLSETRSLILSILAKERGSNTLIQKHDKGRDVILPWIMKATTYANDIESIYGYSVFNGEKIPDALIKKIKLEDKHHEIILTSDGYPIVKESLEESEKELTKILETDPDCYQTYFSTKGLKKGQKSFDDRTFIRFIVEAKEQSK